jgi:hypothetical protein
LRKLIYSIVALAIVGVYSVIQIFNLKIENIDIETIKTELANAEQTVNTGEAETTHNDTPKLYVENKLPNFETYKSDNTFKGYKLTENEFNQAIQSGKIAFNKQNPMGTSYTYGQPVPIIDNHDTNIGLVENKVNEVDMFMKAYNKQFAQLDGVGAVNIIEIVNNQGNIKRVKALGLINKLKPQLALPTEPSEFKIKTNFGIYIPQDYDALPEDGNFDIMQGVEIETTLQQREAKSILEGKVIDMGMNSVTVDYGDIIAEYVNIEPQPNIGVDYVLAKGETVGMGNQTPQGAKFELRFKIKNSDSYINPLLFY